MCWRLVESLSEHPVHRDGVKDIDLYSRDLCTRRMSSSVPIVVECEGSSACTVVVRSVQPCSYPLGSIGAQREQPLPLDEMLMEQKVKQ